jgi:hypothetical protein
MPTHKTAHLQVPTLKLNFGLQRRCSELVEWRCFLAYARTVQQTELKYDKI